MNGNIKLPKFTGKIDAPKFQFSAVKASDKNPNAFIFLTHNRPPFFCIKFNPAIPDVIISIHYFDNEYKNEDDVKKSIAEGMNWFNSKYKF